MNTQHSHTTRWRWAAAAALSATSAIHLALVPSHLSEAPYAGVLFIALAAMALLVATLLLTRGDRLSWVTADALASAAICAYVFSRAVGLPAMSDDVGDWLNPLGVAALLCELAVVAIVGRVLWPRRAAQLRRISRTGPGTSPARSPSV